MAQLNALELTSSLRRRMVDFAVDDNFVRDSSLGEIARRIWSGPPDQGGLISDIWVEGAFPSKVAPTSLDDLVRTGKFHPPVGKSVGLCIGNAQRSETVYSPVRSN